MGTHRWARGETGAHSVPTGPTWRSLSFVPEDLLSNGETEGGSLPRQPPCGAPACKSRRASPAPSFSQHGAQTSVPLPPRERDKDGPQGKALCQITVAFWNTSLAVALFL